MNSINIVGTMTRDCEIKYTPSGVAIGTFGIAYNEKIKQNGEYKDKVNFFEVVCFGKTAENVNNFFKKGSQIGISGSLNFEQWEDNNGQKKSKVNIKMQSFTFIGKKENNQQQQRPYNQAEPYNHSGDLNRPANHEVYEYQQNNQKNHHQHPTINIDDEIPF